MATNTTNDKDTSKNHTTTNQQATREDNESSPYEAGHEIDPTVNPDEEVTPKNVQAPVDDEDKIHQDDVLAADHVRLGYPANMVPRTDEERRRMEEDGLIQ